MTTWGEAVAAKDERLRREGRFYTADLLGKPCVDCGHKIPKALTDLNINTHPACGRDVRSLMREDRARLLAVQS